MNFAGSCPINFDQNDGTFVINLKNSYYALRVLPGGEVIHLGAGPTAYPVEICQAGSYQEPGYVFDPQLRKWEIVTLGDVSYHEYGLAVSFPEAASVSPSDDPCHVPIRDLRLRYVRHEIVQDAKPGLAAKHLTLPRKASILRDTLVLHLRDAAYDFHVRLFYRVTPEYDILERWLELENRTDMPVLLEKVCFASIHLPAGEYELTHAAGAWAREFVTVRRQLLQGEIVLRHAGLNSGHTVNPNYALGEIGRATEEAGAVYFGALEYSGNWSFRFDVALTSSTCIHAGYDPDTFSLVLEPHEVHTTPACAIGVASDGYGGASRRLHAFTRDYILPSSPHRQDLCRPVIYNSWEATYFDVNADGQMKLAHRAAVLGVEMYCVDDGWFSSRRNDRSGLGDWTVSEHGFPQGLTPLIDEVRRLGMRFGLWIEPEMVNTDSDLYRAHPDWVLHYPGRPRTEGRHQLILDFGRPEVVQHILSALDALLDEYDIGFFKWDMNRYVTEPGSVAGGQYSRKHVEGVYHIMDTLRRNHPDLEIESCSGGGGRVDLGVLARTDQVWPSDNTDASDRTYIQGGQPSDRTAHASQDAFRCCDAGGARHWDESGRIDER